MAVKNENSSVFSVVTRCLDKARHGISASGDDLCSAGQREEQLGSKASIPAVTHSLTGPARLWIPVCTCQDLKNVISLSRSTVRGEHSHKMSCHNRHRWQAGRP